MLGKAFVILIAILIGVLSCILPLKLFIVLLAGVLYMAACLVRLKDGLILTILIRSSLDIFNTYTFQLPLVGAVNITSLLGVWIILLAFFALMTGTIKLQSPLSAVFLVFLGISACSILINGEFGTGLVKWLKFASLASFYLLIYNYAKKDGKLIKRLIDCTIASSVIPLTVGAVQFVTGTGNRMTEGLNRLNGTFVHPNPFAYYLLIVIAACFITINNGERNGSKRSITRMIIMLAAFIELIFTYTRGAWIGLVLTAAIVFLMAGDNKKFKFILPAILCTLPFIGLIAARFSGVLSSNMEDSSIATRLFIWRNMFSLSLESPLIGHGLGTFELYAEKAIGWHIQAHNEYLRTFFETGIIGLLSYLTLLICALYYLRGHGTMKRNIIQVTVFSLFLTFMFMSFADNIFDNLVSQWYLWGLTAMVYAERVCALEGSFGQQILLPERRERNLLFFSEQHVPDTSN